jgi:DNA-binding FadR family transcriptional regulator
MDQKRPGKEKGAAADHRRHLVQRAAATLRDIILERAPGAQIGSLSEVASLLGVGIVTVQQAARILEHEGLLAVRRGPGGGYYGTRPDEAALERSLATYMRVHGSSHDEALEITSLLDCELMPAAARCTDDGMREEVARLLERVDGCDTPEDRVVLEEDFRIVLFAMNARPLYELLVRVATRLYHMRPFPHLFTEKDGPAAWKAARRRMLEAILKRDPELARFEATRFREDLLVRLRESQKRGARPRAQS